MRTLTIRCFLAALIRLAVIGSLGAEEPNCIISEWRTAIQTIRLESFVSWPGISGSAPVDAALAQGRMWFVWPDAVTSLDASGAADERSLLALFATRSDGKSNEDWTPEYGTVCSDGSWISWNPKESTIDRRDLLTGIVERTPWSGPPPESVHALPGGRLLILSGAAAFTAGGPGVPGVLAEGLPPLSLTAVSASRPRIAWRDAGSGGIRIADGNGRIREKPLVGEPFPDAAPWGMAWTGSALVIAWPGRLVAIDGRPEGEPALRTWVLENERLPNRWYRLYGGAERLMVHSPEDGAIILISAPEGGGQDDTASVAAIAPNAGDIPEFIDLVGAFSLSAVDLVLAEGGARAAAAFCSWILPHVRSFRSEHPMEPLWPGLERELTRRRAMFGEGFD